jgi:prepilin-type N-terminal cleavage/methylation domain-containing protein
VDDHGFRLACGDEDRQANRGLQGEPMKGLFQAPRNTQAGFTLIELIIATAIGLVVMTGLFSVMFTAYRADRQATSRVEAAGQIRTFEQSAFRDFALSSLPPAPPTCGTVATPCTQDPIQLSGCSITSNDGSATHVWQSHKVTYTWNNTTHVVTRDVGSGVTFPAASDVTAFSWYVDGTSPSQSVVVTIGVTVNWAQNSPYTQSQALRFRPQVVGQTPANVDPACTP